jgi:hypothetical protein
MLSSEGTVASMPPDVKKSTKKSAALIIKHIGLNDVICGPGMGKKFYKHPGNVGFL